MYMDEARYKAIYPTYELLPVRAARGSYPFCTLAIRNVPTLVPGSCLYKYLPPAPLLETDNEQGTDKGSDRYNSRTR